MHLELISYGALTPSTGAAAVAFTGDSLTIKNSKSAARILAMWALNTVTGYHQIVYPSGHDTTRNWRTVVLGGQPDIRNVLGTPWIVQPQELLTITIAGTAAANTELGHLLIEYEDLPGMQGRYIDWDSLLTRAERQVTVQATITTTGVGYSGSEAINVDSDLLRANRDYALVGIETTSQCGAITVQGPDTSNVKIGVPGQSGKPDQMGSFFAMLSRAYGRKTIPVINSGNRTSTLIGLAQNESITTAVVSLNLVLLRNQRDND